MKFRAAVVLATGRQIAVVEVPRDVFKDDSLQEELKVHVMKTLNVTHVAFMMLDENKVPTFMGSKDEVNLLADSDFEHFPWKDLPYPQE